MTGITSGPSGWAVARLQDLFETITDGDHQPPPQVEAGIPFLVIGNVRSGRLDFADVRFVPQGYYRSLADHRKPKRGDVLYTVTGSLGIPALVDTDRAFCVQRHIAMLKPARETNARYLLHALASSDAFQQATKAATGTAQKTLGLASLRAMTVPVAPAPEQARVVDAVDSYLSRLDAAAASLGRAQTKLKAYRASVLKAAVEGRLVPTEAELARKQERTFEPAEALLARILKERRRRWEEAEIAKLESSGKPPKDDRWKDKYDEPSPPEGSNLPELPEGWCWATIEQLAAPEAYALAIGPFGSSLKVEDYRKAGVPLVFVRNIRAESFLDDDDTRYVDEEEAIELQAHVVHPGEILVTKMGDPPGDCSIYPRHRPTAVITADCIKLSPASELCVEYIILALRSPLVQAQIRGATKGVAQKKVSLERFRPLAIPVCPIDEQRRLVDTADALMSTSAALERQINVDERRVARLRQALLKWAFEGKLVDQDPSDEPAEKLLARIRAESATASSTKNSRGRKARTAT